MKNIRTLIVLILISKSFYGQNVGVNQQNPTNSLHISPVIFGNDPLRIDGLQEFNSGDTSILMVNTVTGIVKYINVLDFLSITSGGNIFDNQSIDSLTLDGLTLTAFIENGSPASIDLSDVSDSAINFIFNNADTLLSNSTFINRLKDSIDTDIDSAVLFGNNLMLYENGHIIQADLSLLSDGDSDPTNELQNIQNLFFDSISNLLTIGIEGGASQSVDLSNISEVGWSVNGNSGTNSTIHFIGTTDNSNLIFKRDSIFSGIIAFQSTSFGFRSLDPAFGSKNSAFGSFALSDNTAGIGNTANGFFSLLGNREGHNNSAFGKASLLTNLSGTGNSALGVSALRANITGKANTAVGVNSILSNQIGNNNTAFGTQALSTTKFLSNGVAI